MKREGLDPRTRVGALVVQPPDVGGRLVRLIGQCVVLLGLEKVYEASRGLIPQQDDVARQHGLFVVSIEKSWHIFDEWRMQQVVLSPDHWSVGPLSLDRATLIAALNHFYLYSHVVGTCIVLVWLYLFRRRSFPFVRNVIVLTTALALAIYILFPMMPPRLMGDQMQVPDGYHVVDTLAIMLTDQGRQGQFGYNPYAAMPSLHFAWALIVGVTLLRVGRRRLLRVAGLLYPVVMLVTILVSGNHLLLDAAGSLVVVTSATGAAALARRGALIPWRSGNKPAGRGVATLGRTGFDTQEKTP
jgi:PAP2 superfamily